MQVPNVALWTRLAVSRRRGGGEKECQSEGGGGEGEGGGGGREKWGGRERERKETGGGGEGEREREPEILIRERDERYMRRFSRQKRPIHVAKETYSCGKRDLKEMRDT